MGVVTIEDKKSKDPITYHLDDRLKHNVDTKIRPTLMDKDEDFLIAIDGKEGCGKSTLAFQIGKYVDPTLDLTRIVFTAEDFREAIFKAKKGQVIVYDEAFTGLSSRASLSGINRALVSLMMQMRQKNLCVILVLPTFFLLDKYAAIFRTRILIHVYKSKKTKKKGYFRIYNSIQKKMLFIYGKKDYSYPKNIRTNFRGRFYGKFAIGDAECEKKYRKKKAKALEETQKEPMSAGQVKYRDQRDLMIFLFRKFTKMKYQDMHSLLSDYDFPMSFQQIAKVCGKFGDYGGRDDEAKEKENGNAEKEEEDSGDFPIVKDIPLEDVKKMKKKEGDEKISVVFPEDNEENSESSEEEDEESEI